MIFGEFIVSKQAGFQGFFRLQLWDSSAPVSLITQKIEG